MEFLATLLSKGLVDAIGDTIKWLVSNNIIQREDHVNNTKSFFKSLVKCNTNIKSCYISSNNINSIIEKHHKQFLAILEH